MTARRALCHLKLARTMLSTTFISWLSSLHHFFYKRLGKLCFVLRAVCKAGISALAVPMSAVAPRR